MDDFLFIYLSMLVVGALSFIAFWGAVIYFGIKLFRSNNLSTEQKLKIASGVLGGYPGASGGSSYDDTSREADVRLGAMGGPLPR